MNKLENLDSSPFLGFDFDGTICQEIPWNRIGWIVQHVSWLWKIIAVHYLKPLYHPQGKFIIISARPEFDREIVERWLNKHHIYPQDIVLAPRLFEDREERARWKAQMIEEYNIKTYIENDTFVYNYLKEHCPSLNVILF